MTLSHALSWAGSHVLLILVALWALASLATAVTPVRYRHAPWYGWLVRFNDRLSGLAHPDALGTLKLPGLASAVSPEIAAALALAQQLAKPPAFPRDPPRGPAGFASVRVLQWLTGAMLMLAFAALASVALSSCTAAQGAQFGGTLKVGGGWINDFCRAQQSPIGQGVGSVIGATIDSLTGSVSVIRTETRASSGSP